MKRTESGDEEDLPGQRGGLCAQGDRKRICPRPCTASKTSCTLSYATLAHGLDRTQRNKFLAEASTTSGPSPCSHFYPYLRLLQDILNPTQIPMADARPEASVSVIIISSSLLHNIFPRRTQCPAPEAVHE